MKSIRYYPSDSQYTMPEESPSVSYCAQEDEVHYLSAPSMTLNDLLEALDASNPEDIIFSGSQYGNDTQISSCAKKNGPRSYSVGLATNQFTPTVIYYSNDVTLWEPDTFDYSKVNLSSDNTGAEIVITKNILQQLDGKAEIIIYGAGD